MPIGTPALKTRNGIIISPHHRAKACTVEAAKVVLEAAVAAGAPEDIIGWIDMPSRDMTGLLMKKADIILATGGPSMVNAAYSSGTPALGVGAGNTPAIIDETADILLAVNSIIHSKTFDNGMICASEQSVIVHTNVYDAVRREFAARGCYFLKEDELDKVRKTILINGSLNAKIVGQSAATIAALAGVTVPEGSKILIGEVDSVPGCGSAGRLLQGRTPDRGRRSRTYFLDLSGHDHRAGKASGVPGADEDLPYRGEHPFVPWRSGNTPSSHGGLGDLYNFALTPSLTLGCGSWGGNSVSENVGVKHLLNIKTVVERRENMLWFRAPEKIYTKRGCLPVALGELGEMGKTRAFVVTGPHLYKTGAATPIFEQLEKMGIQYTCFFDVPNDPTLECARRGAAQMLSFKPDVIIALGGGSPMDAAKIMWVLYEHPEADFADMAMRFSDIRKRIFKFPKMGEKAYFVAIPTSAGTGSEATPFAVITDESSGIKYPLADYELMPNMAIVDTDLHMSAPKGLTASSGIDAVSHALEAYASVMATDYTDALALKALKTLFTYLPRAYENGQTDLEAREKVANAATMAGMAFANAFLGVMHSMAHKLGAFHHIAHGLANALMMDEVIRFNSAEVPTKMGTFPQYDHPHTMARYAEIAAYLGCRGASDEELVAALIEKIDDLKQKIGIKPSIRDYVPDEESFLATLDEMTEQAFDDQCTGANPRYPLMSEIRQMYLNAYYGKTFQERETPDTTQLERS